jgi:ABC-type sugar transport system ATPase subunit
MTTSLLAARDITVDFPGVRALDRVSIELAAGEVVGVVGANGSGKTTFLTVLCGLRRPTEGTLLDANGPFNLGSPRDALRRGIRLVPSEPQLATTLTCWENLTLGEPARLGVTLHRGRRRAEVELRQALPNVSPTSIAGDLKKSDRALLGLLVALRSKPRVLALDEPTAVLGEAGVQVVKDAISTVRADGGAVVLVSHRLRDILQLATKIVVLVDGRATYQGPAGDLTPAEIVQKLTVGRAEASITPPPVDEVAATAVVGDVVLDVRDLQTSTGLNVERLTVRHGEIVGVAGLSGSGRSRLLRLVAGVVPSHTGSVRFLNGLLPKTPNAGAEPELATSPRTAFVTLCSHR